MTELNQLTAISPIDGRYRSKCEEIAPFLSESGLIKYRTIIEIEYFIRLSKRVLSLEDERRVDEASDRLKQRAYELTEEDAIKIKQTESVTNHDVKAVEYFVKDILKDENLEDLTEWVHFGLTSQDINNTAIPLSLKHCHQMVWLPVFDDVLQVIRTQSEKWAHVPMLARTHGQPASPTLLGKEWKVFEVRLKEQLRQLQSIPYSCKFGGATGNLNAHYVAFPDTNWHEFAREFSHSLGLSRSEPTTQIEHYDNMAAQFDAMKRINTIMIDLSRDIWTYISMDYFKQTIKAGEVGSSAMPHKVNPIDFENAEGNLGIANAGFEFLAGKLPVSRLQRDLTDSTVLRYVGVPLAHTIIAMKSLIKGLNKLVLNQDTIDRDLDNNWAVIAEALQTILRREGFPKPYETLKDLTRTNEKITKESIHRFIDGLKIPDSLKEEMKSISPSNYTGQS
jgi:adenylosuccinate lyase